MTTTSTGPVLVLLDHAADGALRPPVLELLTAARALGAVQGAWIAGADASGPDARALELLGTYGAESVHRLDVGDADARLTPTVAQALTDVAQRTSASVLLLTSSFENKEIAARVGVVTGAGVIVDASAVVPHTVTVDDGVRRVTVAEHTERAASTRPDLGAAHVVVVGGRGTNGDFAPLEELADLLGGAVGATRVATDEGWIDHEAQIGQTGVTVAPQLYIGAGVSGAVHHRGGMQSAGTIVAINNDPEAPMMTKATYAVVGDMHEVVPAINEEIRRRRG